MTYVEVPAPVATVENPEITDAAGVHPVEMNTFAIVSFVTAFVFAPLGIIFGHISLSQINQHPQKGRGLALSGTIVGYVLTVLGIAYLIAVLVLTVMFAAHTIAQGNDCVTASSAEAALDDSWNNSVRNADLTNPDARKAASVAFDSAVTTFASSTKGLKDPDVKAAVKNLQTEVYIYADALQTPTANSAGAEDTTSDDTLNTASDNWDAASSDLGRLCQIYQ